MHTGHAIASHRIACDGKTTRPLLLSTSSVYPLVMAPRSTITADGASAFASASARHLCSNGFCSNGFAIFCNSGNVVVSGDMTLSAGALYVGGNIVVAGAPTSSQQVINNSNNNNNNNGGGGGIGDG